MQFESVCVLGLGYIGLPTAILFASKGLDVLGVDISERAVRSVNDGKLHIVERGLDKLLKDVVTGGKLRAATKPEAADAFIIAVPTPFREGHQPDLSCIEEAAKSIAPVLKKGDLIILESTSPVGTTEELAKWLQQARPDLSFPRKPGENGDILLAHCPERVLPGKIVTEMVENDRIVGGVNEASSKMAAELYRIFVNGDIALTSSRTAEMCKLTENSFRDVNIAFANELSMLCDKLAIDVWELIKLANRHPRVNILKPGCGVGGHCIAVDPWFIVAENPEEARLIHTARNVNDSKPEWVTEKIMAEVENILAASPDKKMEDLAVACLGLSFKPDIDDLRESPAVAIALNLAEKGLQVEAVEPNIKALPSSLARSGIRLAKLADAIENADLVILNVPHKEFMADIDLLRKKNLINCVTEQAGANKR